MAEKGSAVSQPADRVLVITRIFDAPRELVFKAWTEPERLVQWMGPRGFTSRIIGAIDVRPGGRYRYHMVGPDGGDHWQQGEYREIVPPEKIVCTYEWADAAGNATRPQTLLTLSFEELGGKTRFTLHQALFETTTACDMHREGWSSSLDRLAEYVASAR
jgi:uncharacterized protein YndB with AHSA1/START domain